MMFRAKHGSSGGWIALHRSLIQHPRFSDPEWVTVWIYLLLSVTHKPLKATFDGTEILMRPGQLITGRQAIAEVTGVNPSKVFRILERLKAEQQIEQQAGARHSLITVLNWDSYQHPEQQSEQRASSDASKEGQKSNNKSSSYQHIKHNAKTRESQVPGASSEQQSEQRASSERVEIEHKQQWNNGTRKASLTPVDRISLEKKLGLLRGRLRDLEADTSEQWQRDQNPELVQEKKKLRKQIEDLDNRLLSS